MTDFFSSNIEYLRNQRNMSRAEAAKKFEMTVSAWGGYERGYSVPNLKTFCAIAELFEISTDDLLYKDLRKGGFDLREPSGNYDTDNEIVKTQRQTIRTQEDMIMMLKSALHECKKQLETLKKEIPTIDTEVESRAKPGSSSKSA